MNLGNGNSANRRRTATVAGATAVLVIGVSATAMAWPRGERAGHPRTSSAASSTTAPAATTSAADTTEDTTEDTTDDDTTATASPSASSSTSSSGSTTTAAAKTTSGDVIANLFEWNWTSVATECTDVLGPNGYGGVQVAPPQDSLKLNSGTHSWWEVYQPAGYDLNSRMGSEAEFKSMVSTCRDAGVDVYVDAVINHMSGADMTNPKSYSGNSYTSTNYPGLYTADDFHTDSDCPTSSGTVEDYDNATQVHFCRLSNLEDLKTESTYVRGAIDTYLNKLLGYGVSGFRVDAAKHIPLDDMQAIIDGLDQTVDGTDPYVALEVFGGKGELSQASYSELGSVLGLDASVDLKEAFAGKISTLKTFGDTLIPSSKSLTFVMNHDTDRSGDSISYKNAKTNKLATQFILANDYGTAQVYSSFAWSAPDDAPPSGSDGMVTDTDCTSDAWDCLDRDAGVLAMVKFRNSVGDAAVTNWSDDGSNLIAFSRGTKGWTSLNNNSSAKTQSFQTNLAAGTYCDLVTGGVDDGACAGTQVTVGSDGKASVTVPAMGSIAITKDSLI
ncbi:alpha-amylase family protein [Kineosporia sp. J2-2]|uniref:Alpha-amylase n=1 Tax=Kineosporia corallincola TaxID=2835133 RepID=A0ABS5TEZ0_9ACTN|nr:alpha-amylase family protein [Kineosporia corallincola]MBT0769403.1 alpha-amylase family protein [Kineosporia corallincola]